MPTTLDCLIMRNVFGSHRMRAVYDSQRLVQSWLDTWTALAEAQAAVGVIPTEAARAIRTAAVADKLDIAAIGEGVMEGRHILMPSIRALSAAAGEAGKYVHWGSTTQDIIDTGMVLQLRDGMAIIIDEVDDLIEILAGLARKHRSDAMAGRTHWQHALPITFGFKVALWVEELYRHRERLVRSRDANMVVQVGGAAGTLAALGEHAAAIQKGVAERLGLAVPPAPWSSLRDGLAELVSNIGLLAATIERIDTELGRLSSTEIAEIAEPRTATQVGSSAMPQKRNPINTERAAANCKIVRGLVPVMQSLMVINHERDMSATAAEWLLLPQCMITMDGALELTHRVVAGLHVDPERMRRNLDLTGGGIVAEAVMMGLAEHMGRSQAHEVMIDMARKAREQGVTLYDVLSADPEISSLLPDERLRQLVDPANHLGLAETIVDDVLQRVSA